MAERGDIHATPPPPQAENWVVITHMDVVLVCLISGFFVMGCVIIYFHQCADRLLARDFGGERRFRHRRSPCAVARGLDSDVIDTFPRFRYSYVKGRMVGKGALECAVCLNEFDGDEKLRLLPRCGHVFHSDCIDEWLASHVTCPVCRANLIPGSAGEFRSDSVPSRDSVFDEVTEIAEINSASRERITGKFPRSHSTGHSLIQPSDDCNRFTLNRMVITGSAEAFSGEMSSRKEYRSISVGTGSDRINHAYYERLDRMNRTDRWGFIPTTILFSSGVSSRSSKEESGGDAEDLSTIPRISFTENVDNAAYISFSNQYRPHSPVLSGPL